MSAPFKIPQRLALKMACLEAAIEAIPDDQKLTLADALPLAQSWFGWLSDAGDLVEVRQIPIGPAISDPEDLCRGSREDLPSYSFTVAALEPLAEGAATVEKQCNSIVETVSTERRVDADTLSPISPASAPETEEAPAVEGKSQPFSIPRPAPGKLSVRKRILALLVASGANGATRREIHSACGSTDGAISVTLSKMRNDGNVVGIAVKGPHPGRWYASEFAPSADAPRQIPAKSVEISQELPKPVAAPKPATILRKVEPAAPRRPLEPAPRQSSQISYDGLLIYGEIKDNPENWDAHRVSTLATVLALGTAEVAAELVNLEIARWIARVRDPDGKTVGWRDVKGAGMPVANPHAVVKCACSRQFRPEIPGQTKCNICRDRYHIETEAAR